MRTKHTPGPWKVEVHKDGQLPDWNSQTKHTEIWSQNTHVATIHEHVRKNSPDAANARLIAAAPEMLEALKLVNEAMFNWNVRTQPKSDLVQSLFELTSLIIVRVEGSSK